MGNQFPNRITDSLMLSRKSTCQLSNLINDCVVMVQQAGHLVQETHRECAYEPTSHCRQAKIADCDSLIRQTYLHNLSQLYPGLKLICEGERPVSEAHYADSPFIKPHELLETRKSKVLTPMLLQEKAQQRSRQTQNYMDELERVMGEESAAIELQAGAYTEDRQTNELAVWIDPIDGAKAFTEGDVQDVTNMIGITVNGRPLVGIIHKPFTNQRRNSSRTYVGSIESGLFYFDHSFYDRTTSTPTYVSPFEEQEASQSQGGHFQPHLCSGADAEQESIMERVLSDIMPLKVNRVNGPGNKFLHMANENSDYFP